MRAVRYDAVGELPTLVEIDEPVCPDDGVVVAVRATGVCRSDWHAWQGHEEVALPHVPGHEYAGTVAEVGRDVATVEVGDRVTVPFVLGCGTCDYCRSGEAQVCPDQLQPGFTLPGSFAELVAVPRADANVVRLPDEVSYAAAAALGCRFATAYRAVVAHGQVQRGQWLAVMGCGGVGLSAVMIAVARGARVVAVDVRREALDSAAELGAEATLEATDATADAIRDITGGGAHVGLDAIGDPAAAAASIGALRPRGRHVQVGLLVGDDASTALPMDLVVGRELAVLGSHGMPAVDYPALLELVADGRLRPDRLVTRRIGLEDAGRALAEMSGTGITLVEPQETREP
ncbi:zinc-dependent alcohol dehydrogenase family protein [Nocardioides islandensis]|uniref:Zinc-dependent alcohol dehydrogenase family protein n=1 Tax=Nocardioides islandensis TaxID=433663 RepID=A0A930YMQ9_9ACTN|nr:zinc-dependent alcohol dehydrogenase family protein [Nocardioides islandensis]MBF4765885.1 zinc-dependent alcohol dehydrogenase family protein [Nocardioides islandensis]